jgi:hypothetical protein
MVVPMSHPDPNGPADFTPIEVGEVWENPVAGERATILELCCDVCNRAKSDKI